MRSRTFVGVVALSAATLSGCGGGSESTTTAPSESSSPTEPPKGLIETVYTERCYPEISKANDKAANTWYDPVVEIADENRTLLINTGDEDAFPAFWSAVGCIFSQLETPAAITTQMDNTTSMMGRQEAEDGPLTYQWTYHPDNGFQAIITEEPPAE